MTNDPDTIPSPDTLPGIDPARAGAILTIDLGAIIANWRLLAQRIAPAECGAVVKADAYGLGAAAVAPALAAAGVRTFFVAHLTEAIALRALLPDALIGVFHGLMSGCEADYLEHRLLPVLNHPGEIDRWSALARRQAVALPAFIHIDSGMNRLGLGRADVEALAAAPHRLTGIALSAFMSHLACADEQDHPMSATQLAAFRAALARLPPAPASLCNSAGVFLGPEYRFDLARPGAALYGVNPTPWRANPMRPVVRLDGRVLQVRDVDSGMTVGYGATHKTGDPARIATISVGYADGYLRSLSGRGTVAVAGRLVPVIGRVSMDLITVEITSLPEGLVQPGTLVELIGPHLDVDAVAGAAGTIGYEILTSLGRRHARRYVGGAR